MKGNVCEIKGFWLASVAFIVTDVNFRFEWFAPQPRKTCCAGCGTVEFVEIGFVAPFVDDVDDDHMMMVVMKDYKDMMQ